MTYAEEYASEFESWGRDFLEKLGYESPTIEDFIEFAWNLVQKGIIK